MDVQGSWTQAEFLTGAGKVLAETPPAHRDSDGVRDGFRAVQDDVEQCRIVVENPCQRVPYAHVKRSVDRVDRGGKNESAEVS